jgi:hypothetical protein
MTTAPSAALAYNLYLKHDLVRVAPAFAEAGIPWLLLKGFGLADAAYGGLAARPMVDNDIVVPPAQVERAHQVLLRLGFYDRPGNVLALNRAADFEHPMHHPYPDVETGLELHWHIHAPELFRGAVEPYFERAVTREICGMPMLTLNNEDRLVQLATHWAQHGLNKPRILADIARLWNRQTEVRLRVSWPALVRRLHEVGAHATFALALQLLQQVGQLEMPVPSELHSRRAVMFARTFDARLSRVTDASAPPLEPAEEHQLRLASWALLTPGRCLASARRELLPSRARLSRIAGRELSIGETLALFWERQAGGIGKLLGP